jgi:hypothetical protein
MYLMAQRSTKIKGQIILTVICYPFLSPIVKEIIVFTPSLQAATDSCADQHLLSHLCRLIMTCTVRCTVNAF